MRNNMIPLKVNMQVYFADADYQIIDSLFVDDDLLMQGAPLDENDKVRESVHEEKSVELTRNKIENIKPTEYLIIKAASNTKNAEVGRYTKFYSYYTIDFQIKSKVDLKINSRDL